MDPRIIDRGRFFHLILGFGSGKPSDGSGYLCIDRERVKQLVRAGENSLRKRTGLPNQI